VLVIAQVAASLVLLFGAGLLLRALVSAQALELGFKTSGVVYADYDPGAARYTVARADALNRGLLDSARSMPGVTAAALTSHVPLHGGVRWTAVRLIGTRTLIETPHAIVSSVSSEYFAALQIPFIEGRGFNGPPTAPSVIISEGSRIASGRASQRSAGH
jgi:putative ABC transport system permease protein